MEDVGSNTREKEQEVVVVAVSNKVEEYAEYSTSMPEEMVVREEAAEAVEEIQSSEHFLGSRATKAALRQLGYYIDSTL